MTKFEEVLKIDVSEKTEKKGNLTYLSWAWAWSEFKKVYPDATYEVKKFDGIPYIHDADTGYMVYTTVTAGGQTYEMWLPVMDARNKTLMNATMFDINKTIMRCLTKNLAMFGLGLYIYAGEDLPEDADKGSQNGAEGGKKQSPKNPPEEDEKVSEKLEQALKTAIQITNKGDVLLENIPLSWLQRHVDGVEDKALKEAMQTVIKYKMGQELKENREELPFK